MNKDFVLDFVAGGMDYPVKVQCTQTLVQVHPVYIPPSICAIIFWRKMITQPRAIEAAHSNEGYK